MVGGSTCLSPQLLARIDFGWRGAASLHHTNDDETCIGVDLEVMTLNMFWARLRQHQFCKLSRLIVDGWGYDGCGGRSSKRHSASVGRRCPWLWIVIRPRGDA